MQQLTFQELPSTRRFGIELEVSNNLTKKQIGESMTLFESLSPNKRPVVVTNGVEGWDQTKNNDYWHVKFDRTCGPLGKGYDSGWEIASFIGKGREDVIHVSKAASFMKAAGAETNFNCGFHIHVDAADFNSRDISNLLARWLKIEDLLISICHHSRRNNKHCMSLRKRYQTMLKYYTPELPEWLWYTIGPSDLGIHNNNDKRVTLNTVGFATYLHDNHYDRSTVELRLPECVLEESHVRHWTSLILNIVDSSKHSIIPPQNVNSCKDLNEALLYMGLVGEVNFAVLDQDLLETKIWLLNQIFLKSDNIEMATQAKKLLEFITLI